MVQPYSLAARYLITGGCFRLFSLMHFVLQKNILGGFGLGTTASIQLNFKRADGQPVKLATLKTKGTEPEQLPLFSSKDTICAEVWRTSGRLFLWWGLCQSKQLGLSRLVVHKQASVSHRYIYSVPGVHQCLLKRLAVQVKIANQPGKKLDHSGIRVQLLGQIELASERGHPQDFLGLGMSQLLAQLPVLLVALQVGHALQWLLPVLNRAQQTFLPVPACSAGLGCARRHQHAAELSGRVCQCGDAV